MKIILKQDHEKLGKTGDVLNVKDGYAMNYLLPNSIAMKANDSNMKVLEEIKKLQAKKLDKEIAEAQKIAAELSTVSLEIKAKAADELKLFGSVTSGTIAESLMHKGFKIDKKNILLEEPIKEIGTKTVAVKLAGNVTAQISVSVIKEEA
ncbi:MAG: 50S ribosomal protein L9 [Chlorobi bacterium]|nr:50S ribosomal protein L9 [Chlorobiota bacterium]MCI0716949.1 50S ribosomal protein L9 [Chlorobiota bacterium]